MEKWDGKIVKEEGENIKKGGGKKSTISNRKKLDLRKEEKGGRSTRGRGYGGTGLGGGRISIL